MLHIQNTPSRTHQIDTTPARTDRSSTRHRPGRSAGVVAATVLTVGVAAASLALAAPTWPSPQSDTPRPASAVDPSNASWNPYEHLGHRDLVRPAEHTLNLREHLAHRNVSDDPARGSGG